MTELQPAEWELPQPDWTEEEKAIQVVFHKQREDALREALQLRLKAAEDEAESLRAQLAELDPPKPAKAEAKAKPKDSAKTTGLFDIEAKLAPKGEKVDAKAKKS